MRRYSAAEAISPAWEHAKAWLWQGTSKKTYLQLAAVATLAGTFSATAGFNSGNFRQRMHNLNARQQAANPQFAHTPHLHGAALIPLFLVLAIIGGVIFYLSVRFKFVLVNALATRRREIRLLWDLYGDITWQWIALTLVLTVAAGALGFSAFFGLRHTTLGQAGNASMTVLGILGGLALAIAAWILRDFVLPVLALEGSTIGFAWERAMNTLSAEPGEFALYFLLKIILSFILVIARVVVFIVGILILIIPLILVGVVPAIFLRHAGMAGTAIVALIALVLGLIYVAASILLLFAINGPITAFFTSWGLYFYGGRYPLLGEMLEPSIAVSTFTPPPSFPSRDEEEDDPGSGPDLPLNPQPVT
ncbi:DUF7544 domain-containing protein [Terriglobus saanensis]|uniref:Uncharacterized protein n=1 Tax=Terriglobus saanensis (strain ATCC BAA-1853 / DSM 23119 / SP1PR4) TaxID=401053 RepID=E8V0D3_TERSS|nr:hypothetical protein [Terriglobus saanensis]ADV84416.1 hypothetical protein AciPR4_3664 [Terriglobus saanensis SP1PR4]